MKQIGKEISDSKKYDIILNKLSQVLTKDDLQSFIEALIINNGIEKGIEPLWAK
jgi:hypothetical protein